MENVQIFDCPGTLVEASSVQPLRVAGAEAPSAGSRQGEPAFARGVRVSVAGQAKRLALKKLEREKKEKEEEMRLAE